MDFPEAYRIEQMLDRIHKEMKAMATDVSRLASSVDALATAVDTLITLRAVDQATIANLGGQLAAAQPAIDALQAKVDAETQKVTAVEPPAAPAPPAAPTA